MGIPLAVVTGASSGIGAVFARRLAATHELVLIARNQSRLQALAAELRAAHGTVITILAADLTDAAQLDKVAMDLSRRENLTLLVNNAGFGDRGDFWKADVDVLDRMLKLHVIALMRLSHVALQVMTAKNEGAIINLASVAAYARRAGSASYGASKSWVVAFTEGLHADLTRACSAVTVQALCPGYTYSEFHALMNENRAHVAPPSLWLTPEHVVDDSLAALKSRTLRVVPGWRYKLIVGLLKLLPLSLSLRAAALATPRR
jgi:uncharacterized protein